MKKIILLIVFLVLISAVFAAELTPELGQQMLEDEALFIEHLDEIKAEYNNNLDEIPAIVTWLFGDDVILLHIEGKEKPVSLVMDDGVMQGLGLGAVEDHTLDAYVSQETMVNLLTGELNIGEAIDDKLITYEAVSFGGSIKYGLAGWLTGFL